MAERKPLTHARQVDAAKPEQKTYKLNAGDGLFLEVTPIPVSLRMSFARTMTRPDVGGLSEPPPVF
ncbi:MAG: hypothetical protein ACRERR_02445 [Moraxellaceae bacterium]